MKRGTLVYMPGRGIGESLRMLFALGDWEWDEELIRSREHRLALKSETVHGTVPFVRLQREGSAAQVLEQVPAIQRHLARDADLLPEAEPERYRVEMVTSLLKDFVWELVTDFYQPDLDAARKALLETTGPRYLPSLARALAAWGSEGHVVGTALTLADVAALDALTNYEDRFPKHLDEAYPSLARLSRQLAATPKLADYLASPLRRGIPDEAYAEHVRRCF